MEVQLTPNQQAFIRAAIDSDRIELQEDAVRQALALWEERERMRAAFLAKLDDAAASLDRSEGIPITQESMRKLAAKVKRRGFARLTADEENA
jgi:Arc/MetJ-type ribon-helix-helix transcriptional regulator